MARGIFPQICVIRSQSETVAFGTSFWARVWEEDSLSWHIRTSRRSWNCSFVNCNGSLVVTTNSTFWVLTKMFSRNCVKSPFVFGPPLNMSSAWSRIRTVRSDISLRRWESSASIERNFGCCCSSLTTVRVKRLRMLNARSGIEWRPGMERKYTENPRERRWFPTAIATEVFPNPGGPQIDTILADPEATWSMISSHSVLRPVKQGTFGGQYDFCNDGLLPFEKTEWKGQLSFVISLQTLFVCSLFKSTLLIKVGMIHSRLAFGKQQILGQ